MKSEKELIINKLNKLKTYYNSESETRINADIFNELLEMEKLIKKLNEDE